MVKKIIDADTVCGRCGKNKMMTDNGGYVAYCDTDSIFVSPAHVKLVQEFFASLNPYSTKVDMFKVE